MDATKSFKHAKTSIDTSTYTNYIQIKNTLIFSSKRKLPDISEAVIHWDLVGMKQDDPKLIEAIKTKVLWKPPIKKGLNLGVPLTKELIGGQFGQPLVVEEVLKKHKLWKKSVGFFIESGAADGVRYSNTLYFESKYNWSGLLVEPNPRCVSHYRGSSKSVDSNRKVFTIVNCV